MARYGVSPAIVASVRRLSRKGWTADAIAPPISCPGRRPGHPQPPGLAPGLAPGRGPPAAAPRPAYSRGSPAARGRMAGRCRRRVARPGRRDGRRLPGPDGTPATPSSATGRHVNRPRPTREHAALSAWPRGGDDDGPELLPLEPDQVVAPAPAAEVLALPSPSGDSGATHAPRRGALDDDRVAELLRLRALGRPLEDLARHFDVSVATVKRALRPGYRGRPAPSPARVEPQIAAAGAPPMAGQGHWKRCRDD